MLDGAFGPRPPFCFPLRPNRVVSPGRANSIEPMPFNLFRRKPVPVPRRDREVEAAGRLLPVTIAENARATRLTLRIEPGGRGLKVTIPPHVSEAQVDQFIHKHRNWVATRIARLPQPVDVAPGSMVLYLGVEHRVVHVNRLRGVVEAGFFAQQPALFVPGDPARMGRKIGEFLKREARTRLDEAVSRHAAALGVRPRAIRITDTTSRWGSCSTTRTLSFSWRIVMAPPEVLDYLAAHEVAHLKEMNHSPAFWALVKQLCPGMKVHKTWLKHHGAALHAFEAG